MKKLLSFIYFFLCAMMLFSVSAFAYIDPSAMTYIIQIIAGVAIAAGAAFGFYFRKIKRALSKFKKNDSAYDDWDYDEDDDDDTGFDDYDIDGDEYLADPGAQPASATPAPMTSDTTIYQKPVTINTVDKYDENGGKSLEAENHELRRLLAQEQEKVAILKKALHICSEGNR